MNKYIIDISHHNGNVDLKKAKEYISGVIARCSWGWSSSNIDKQWKNNASQANQLGIPLFAYHFCYARNDSEARKEAKLALRTCKGYEVNVIYYDMESSDYQGALSNDLYYRIAKAFCDEIENAGYSVGIYANENWFRTKLIHQGFSSWTLWIANYGNNNGYNNWNDELRYNPFRHVLLHQFTSNARNGILKDIKGISSSGLDCSLDHGLLKTFVKSDSNSTNKKVLEVGDKVHVKKDAKWYDGKSIAKFVFNNEYEIIQIKDDRVVIGINKKVTGAISIDDIY